MRTLTQVWVFLITMSFLFMLISFQLLGRPGLFISFVLVLLFLYAALRNSMKLLRGSLNPHLFSGNDPSGFLSEIEKNKAKFGFKKVEIYTTKHRCPPLVWRNHEEHGYVIINERLLDQLYPEEVKLLAVFLLCHLQNRSFVTAHLLSIIKIPVIFLAGISQLFAALTHKILKTDADIIAADLKFITMAETGKYDAGYFINKLHRLSLNHFHRPNSYCYFSTLSLPQKLFLNEFGLPNLKVRLKKMMGFAL